MFNNLYISAVAETQTNNLISDGPCLIVILNDKLRLEKNKYMVHGERADIEWLCFSGSPQAAFNPHSSATETAHGKYSS